MHRVYLSLLHMFSLVVSGELISDLSWELICVTNGCGLFRYQARLNVDVSIGQILHAHPQSQP